MPAPGLRGLVLTAAAAPAWAHVPPPSTPAVAAFAWNTEWWLLALLALAAGLYARGLWRLWGEAGTGRGIRRVQAAAFAGGWCTLAVALVSPLDALGTFLFSAHMVQHELLMVVAAPLLVLGRPLAAWTWAFGPVRRRALGQAVRAGWLQAAWRALTGPVVAWALHGLALWLWHVPGWFGAALVHEPLHVLQHASFLGTALLFWWAALGPDPRGARGGWSLALLFTTMLHTAVLGALLALAPAPWYAPYAQRAVLLGMDPLEDQQLGGLVMWVPSGLAYLLAALVVLGKVLRPGAAPAGRAGIR